MISPSSSPDGLRTPRPYSIISASSPDSVPRQRPQSMIGRRPRSNSRLSMGSGRGGGTRASDDEMKTAVKVVVRVRPPLGPTDQGYELIPQRFQRSTVQVPTPTSLVVEAAQGKKLFIFDRVFGEDTTQKGLWAYLEDSVDSFLQGYNVSILAYGQSGAGKSYTMGTSGPEGQTDPSSRGIIPRAAYHLFQSLQGSPQVHSPQNLGLKTPTRYSVGSINHVLQQMRPANDQPWEMSVTYVEIYNEQLRDLLLPESTPGHERPQVQIREDNKARILVEGLHSVPVKSSEELFAVLNHGSMIRQTDATAINSQSSRSHAVFTVNLRQRKTQLSSSPPKTRPLSLQTESVFPGEGQVTVESKLHFVDLAGSERLKNTGATGDRAREGISINAGLASLGKVISQLSSRSAGGFVSYRDSKLTRMLQDSLGGNAITYMVACVTPAEFHLSETLNTVQYAQRARNIQSKPRIQQVNEDAEKQATIDRLKTEISFLRQQIHSVEAANRRTGTIPERLLNADLDLQNQLRDVQESYRHLSERHAKLVSELSRTAGVPEHATDNVAESAADRLKRSQENQQQIEQIILEYERTIQSLETNLSTTRSSLAHTESNLLEKETKCAYAETINNQLGTRVQNLMDRETSTEAYLRELERRLEEQASGGEQQNAMVAELRREMARVRESETNAEDYINTLEERLAEADQDLDTMQREVERLEHLIERQRSLRKLDGLMHELDHSPGQQALSNDRSMLQNSPSPSTRANGLRSGKQSQSVGALKEAEEVELPAPEDDELVEPIGPAKETNLEDCDDAGLETLEKLSLPAHVQASLVQKMQVDGADKPSPAQAKFVQEKFESVSQELFDLRLEHESTVNDLDLLSAKYHEALRTLAEMQDHLDEARHTPSRTISSGPLSRPRSFVDENKNSAMRDMASSRSLSSELSMAGESVTTAGGADLAMTGVKDLPASSFADSEIEKLQAMLAEHERNMSALKVQYKNLQDEHSATLSTVDKLKAEAQRSRSPLPPSPGVGMIRRSTSQLGSGVDRAQRSIVSLRSLLSEELDGKPDRLEGAEVHLSAATYELATRQERIQSLEAELKKVKKEMDMKSTIISGLTRERNSLKTGPQVDLSMISQMRDQLIQKETELKTLHEGYAGREQELLTEIEVLQAAQPSVDSVSSSKDINDEEIVVALRKELAEWKSQHDSAQGELADRHRHLETTKGELAAALSSIDTLKAQQSATRSVSEEPTDNMFARAAAASAMQTERDQYQATIAQLKQDIETHQSTSAAHVEKLSVLTEEHAAGKKEIEEHQKIIQTKQGEIEGHQKQITVLGARIEEAQSAVEFHKHGLKTLHEAHANEIEGIKLAHAGSLAGYDDKITESNLKHVKELEAASKNVDAAKATLQDLMGGAEKAFGHPTSEAMLVSHIQDVIEEKKHLKETNKRLGGMNAELESQLHGRQGLKELEELVATANAKITNYQETIRNLANEIGNHEDTIRDKDKVIAKHEATIETIQAENQKKVSMVEELEQQLQSGFEQHHKRVSTIQTQQAQALLEAQQRIVQLEKDLARTSLVESDSGSRTNTMKSGRPQSPQIENVANRSNSMSSNLRKSASIASLPSPPPAIPLPPLPILPGITSNPSPPQSRHASKEVSTPVTPNMPNMPNTSQPPPTQNTERIKRQSAIIEDQDSRLRTMEKHLHAEKQLTATLEEALVDLETQSNKLRVDSEGWKKKAWALEEEVAQVRKERKSERMSVQAVEEEVKKRREAEAARAQLEERMRLLSQSMGHEKKKKQRAALNCF